jgi:hypothetical protein
MILADLDMQARLWHLVGLVIALLQPVLVIVLCAGFVLASAHLAAMLGTQWGKRRVSGKALAFSIAVHISIACGIIALLPEYAQQRRLKAAVDALESERDAARPEEDRVVIRTTVEEPLPEPLPVSPTGAQPVWEQLPETITPIVERTPVETPQPEEVPLERPQPQEPVVRAPAESAPLPELPEIRPQQLPRTETGELELAAVPRRVDDPQAQARPDVSVPEAARMRSPVVLGNPQPVERVERPETDTVQRTVPDAEPARDVGVAAGVVVPAARAQRTSDDVESDPDGGPAPSTLRAERPAPGDNVPGGAAGSGADDALVGRTRTRAPRSINDTGTERVRPAAIPQRPDASDDLPISSLLARTGPESSRIEAPSLARPGGGDSFDGSRVPATYQLRAQDQRKAAARQFGGTEDSEQAVERSLAWLAQNQQPDGYWDADAHGAGDIRPDPKDGKLKGRDGVVRGAAGRDADTGLTGLAVLAFLGAGNTPDEGPYSANVSRAVRWLAAQQRADGSIAGPLANGATDFMYCHAMATFALAEAYALRTNDASVDWLRSAVERAVRFTLTAQLEDGGWRYGIYDKETPADGDMSIFGWQLMALKSAELGGIPIPADAKRKMIDFLKVRGRGRNGGLAGYRAGERETPAMTAEALFCKQMLGITRTNPASTEAVQFLMQSPPRRSTLNLYYWYYGTLAMFQYGGEPWERWNDAVRDLLVQEQRTDGPLAGSWDPRDIWGAYGGRIYSTAVATLCLEVYYRYLPLYRLGEEYDRK